MERPGSRGSVALSSQGMSKAPTGSALGPPQRPSSRAGAMPVGGLSGIAGGMQIGGAAPMMAPGSMMGGVRPPTGQSGMQPPGTANRMGPPGTGGLRPGTQSGMRPGTSSLNANLKVQDRPVTQQGMSGLKTAAQGPGRQVMDRSYFLDQIRARVRDLQSANADLRTEADRYEQETPTYSKLEKRRDVLASDVRRLQSELASFNLAIDRMASGGSAKDIAAEANALEERNRVERRKVENVAQERAALEKRVRELEEQWAADQRQVEAQLQELPPDQRRRFAVLQADEQSLLQDKAGLEEQIRGLEAAVQRAEAEVKGSGTKEAALRLTEELRAAYDRKYEMEADDRKMSMTVDEQKDALKAKMKRDNADVARAEDQIRETADEIKSLEAKVQQYQGMRAKNKPEAAAAPAEDVGEKYQRLISQEGELNAFLESFPASLDESRASLREKQSQIVTVLTEIQRIDTVLASGQLPSAQQYQDMRDELEYKRMQLDNAKKTADQLKAEEESRKAELGKIDSLEEKIAVETKELAARLETLKKDIALVGSPEQVRAKIEEKRLLLEQQRTSLLLRRDMLKRQLADRQAKYSAKTSQLHQNDLHIRLERLEQRYRQLEMNAHQMRSVLAAREGEGDFSAVLGEIAAMTDKINQEAIRLASL